MRTPFLVHLYHGACIRTPSASRFSRGAASTALLDWSLLPELPSPLPTVQIYISNYGSSFPFCPFLR